MKLSFSTRGWQDLTWQEILDTAEEMGFQGVELYHVSAAPELTDRSGPFHIYSVPSTYRELRRMTELPISGGYGRDPGAWARFYESVSAGEPACVSFAMLTVEGDPIYCYLDYDGTDFYLLEDSAFDSYGGGYYEARYTALTEKSSPLGERTDGKTGRYLQYTLSGGEGDQVIFSYQALDE